MRNPLEEIFLFIYLLPFFFLGSLTFYLCFVGFFVGGGVKGCGGGKGASICYLGKLFPSEFLWLCEARDLKKLSPISRAPFLDVFQ